MTLINRTQPGSEELEISYANAVDSFAERFLDEREESLLFLGAGASLDEGLQFPAGDELSKDLADESKLDWHEEIPLSTMAFYYEALRGRKSLNGFLVTKLKTPKKPPTASKTIHTLLDIIAVLEERKAKCLVVTTNYDQLFEDAYRTKFDRNPEVVIFRGGIDANSRERELYSGFREGDEPGDWRPEQATCLFKLHGCISEAEAKKGDNHYLVITEEDYINFIANMQSEDPKRRLPTHLSARITKSPIAFVGYSLSDWNFRVLFKATGEKARNDRYAVQFLQPDEQLDAQARAKKQAVIAFWQRKDVKIVNADAAHFMADLLLQIRHRAERVGVTA